MAIEDKEIKEAIDKVQSIGVILSECIKPYEDSIREMAEKYNMVVEQIQKSIKPIFDAIETKIIELIKVSRPVQAACKLAQHQYVQWKPMTDEFVDEIIRSKDINEMLRAMYEKECYQTFYQLVDECLNNDLTEENKRILTQSASAFRTGDTDLAAIGITIVIDGALAQIPEINPKNTSIKNRAEKLIGKLDRDESLNTNDIAFLAFLIPYCETYKSIGKTSSFADEEPENINRHWLLHGRSNSRKTKLDCVKLVRFLYATIILNKMTCGGTISEETGKPFSEEKASGCSVNSAVNAMQMLQKEMAGEAEKAGLFSEADINAMVKEVRDGGA